MSLNRPRYTAKRSEKSSKQAGLPKPRKKNALERNKPKCYSG